MSGTNVAVNQHDRGILIRWKGIGKRDGNAELLNHVPVLGTRDLATSN